MGLVSIVSYYRDSSVLFLTRVELRTCNTRELEPRTTTKLNKLSNPTLLCEPQTLTYNIVLMLSKLKYRSLGLNINNKSDCFILFQVLLNKLGCIKQGY